jgi:transposase
MAEQTSIADKQYLAKILFTREKLEQKIIAKKVSVSEKTISKWVNDFNWRNLRNRLLVGKEEILTGLYEEMEQMQEAIREKEPGKRFSDSKMADAKLKITASIRNLETELAIADLVESGIRFIKYIQQTGTTEQVLEYSELWNAFLLTSMKKT